MKKLKMELDIISNLPDEVIEEILSQLPIRDAVRTSILSTKWRYKWKVLQHLEFDERCVSAQSHPTSSSFVNIVDHVLLLHTGPIHLFRISNAEEELATRDMDRWIMHVCRNPVIKYMMIDVWKGDRYNVPSCLFSCQDIVHLDLFGCLLKPPPCKFKGFRSLKTVDFLNVTMTQDVFENLIGSSPLLENLSLGYCDGFTSINIDAPNLLFLLIVGVFEDLNLTNTSNLTEVIIYLEANGDKRWGPARSGNLIKFFVHHPCIKKFTNRNFLKYPSVDVLPDKLPNPCQHLNFLSVNISFDDPDGTSIVLCLLKSSPALKELEILVDSEKVSPAVKEVESSLYDNYNCTYTQLRLVKMTYISGAKVQLDFIKFLLLNSPVLERVSLRPASVDGVSKLLKDLLLLKRDSKHAEIMIMDP